MKKNDVVILDLDDTSADLKSRLQEIYRKETGDPSIHFSDWEVFSVAQRYGVTNDRLLELFIEDMTIELIDPHHGLVEVTAELQDRGCHIEIVTARAWHPEAYDVTEQWLKKHGVSYNNINIVPLTQCKEEATRYLEDVKLFIDDRFEHCDSMMASGRVEKCLLYSQPWNAHLDSTDRIVKIDNLYDVLRHV